MSEAPIIKRGDRYFCPECGHLMPRLHKSCQMCHLEFKGMVKDETRSPTDPLKIPEIEEKYEEVHIQRYIWSAIGGILFLGAIAVLLIILFRR